MIEKKSVFCRRASGLKFARELSKRRLNVYGGSGFRSAGGRGPAELSGSGSRRPGAALDPAVNSGNGESFCIAPVGRIRGIRIRCERCLVASRSGAVYRAALDKEPRDARPLRSLLARDTSVGTWDCYSCERQMQILHLRRGFPHYPPQL